MTAVDTGGGIAERLAALLAGDPAQLSDPYPLYAELRERASLCTLGTVAVLSRHEDVKLALRDAERLSSRTFVGSRTEQALARMSDEERERYAVVAAFDSEIVAHVDGEEHSRMRRIVHRAFTPRRISELRDAVQRYTDELLDELDRAGEADLMTVAHRLPLLVIAEMLGVPREDLGRIREWSGPIGRSRGTFAPEPLREACEAIGAFRAYVESRVAAARGSSQGDRPDLVASLVDANETERLTTGELTATFVHLLFAGHETTTNLIAIGMLDLLQRPGQWATLCGDPEGVAPGAVEELLRFVSPVQTINRVAVEDVELADGTVHAGTAVVGLLGSANRDPRAFERPDELDLLRDDRAGHVGLGFGPHFCLGAALARLETTVFLTTVAARYPTLRLAAHPSTLHWGGSAMLRSPNAVPVSLT
jgi:cytochrome P450